MTTDAAAKARSPIRRLAAAARIALAAAALSAAAAAAVQATGIAAPAEPAPTRIDCDCAGIAMGPDAMGRIAACRRRQAAMMTDLSRGDFALTLRDGRVAGGSICSAEASGPAAWPVIGAVSRGSPAAFAR